MSSMINILNIRSIDLVLSFILAFVLISGCTSIQETAKTIWGSSTKALEIAREQAIAQNYQCSYDQCYKEVLKIAELEEFDIFIKDKMKKHIVLMGIKGSVDTTEVGIFFTELNQEEVKIEVTSLSTNAKEKVADLFFPQLNQVFVQKK